MEWAEDWADWRVQEGAMRTLKARGTLGDKALVQLRDIIGTYLRAARAAPSLADSAPQRARAAGS